MKSSKQDADILSALVRDAKSAVEGGYYHVERSLPHAPKSLKRAILDCSKTPVIAEVKFASPAAGLIRKGEEVEDLALAMKRGGAVALSILTEPKRFKGSLDHVRRARSAVRLPILMKDIIVDPVQIDAAASVGADAVLLIYSAYDLKMVDYGLREMVEHAHRRRLEVLLEAHIEQEFLAALGCGADLLGINNRDLKSMEVDIHTTERILRDGCPDGVVVVSESGLDSPEQLSALKKIGVKGFLIGTAVMRDEDVEGRVRGFVEAV